MKSYLQYASLMLVALANGVNALPGRSPICDVDAAGQRLAGSRMGPQVADLAAQGGITFTADKQSYQPGEVITITMTAPTAFQGFLFYAAPSSSPDRRVGQFEVPQGMQNNAQVCGAASEAPNSVLTHTQGQDYPGQMTFRYTAPSSNVGDLTFKAVVVKREANGFSWGVFPSGLTVAAGAPGAVTPQGQMGGAYGKPAAYGNAPTTTTTTTPCSTANVAPTTSILPVSTPCSTTTSASSAVLPTSITRSSCPPPPAPVTVTQTQLTTMTSMLTTTMTMTTTVTPAPLTKIRKCKPRGLTSNVQTVKPVTTASVVPASTASTTITIRPVTSSSSTTTPCTTPVFIVPVTPSTTAAPLVVSTTTPSAAPTSMQGYGKYIAPSPPALTSSSTVAPISTTTATTSSTAAALGTTTTTTTTTTAQQGYGMYVNQPPVGYFMSTPASSANVLPTSTSATTTSSTPTTTPASGYMAYVPKYPNVRF
ncbi:hypothetical protein HK102_004056 [Quaeritorhiza haematococci]|nr:hypothetical protein HK102_004056 [Quaeritorhiza haematococci]